MPQLNGHTFLDNMVLNHWNGKSRTWKRDSAAKERKATQGHPNSAPRSSCVRSNDVQKWENENGRSRVNASGSIMKEVTGVHNPRAGHAVYELPPPQLMRFYSWFSSTEHLSVPPSSGELLYCHPARSTDLAGPAMSYITWPCHAVVGGSVLPLGRTVIRMSPGPSEDFRERLKPDFDTESFTLLRTDTGETECL
ncbi:Nodal Modulator 2 [Manis pentadactyla]|nr:Nodal Modulator 2 [Manis pentadactyla]